MGKTAFREGPPMGTRAGPSMISPRESPGPRRLPAALIASLLVAMALAATPLGADEAGQRAAVVLLVHRDLTASPTLCFDGATGDFRIGDACLPLVTPHAVATDAHGRVVRLDRREARAADKEGRGWFDVLPDGTPSDEKDRLGRPVDHRLHETRAGLAFSAVGPMVWLDGANLPGRTDDKSAPLPAALAKRLAADMPAQAAALRAGGTKLRVLGQGHVDLDGDGQPDEIVELLASRDRAVPDSFGRRWETVVSALYLLPGKRGGKPAIPELIDTFTDGNFALGPILDLDGDRRSELIVGLLDTRSPGPPGYVHRVLRRAADGRWTRAFTFDMPDGYSPSVPPRAVPAALDPDPPPTDPLARRLVFAAHLDGSASSSRFEVPTLLFFDDGTVIFVRVIDHRYVPFVTRLDEAHRRTFLEDLGVPADFFTLPDTTSLPKDAPSLPPRRYRASQFALRIGERQHTATVYIDLRPCEGEVPCPRDLAPPWATALHDRVRAFDTLGAHPDSREWTPDRYSLWLEPWGGRDKVETTIEAPAWWPAPGSSRAVPVARGDLPGVQLIFPAAEAPRVEKVGELYTSTQVRWGGLALSGSRAVQSLAIEGGALWRDRSEEVHVPPHVRPRPRPAPLQPVVADRKTEGPAPASAPAAARPEGGHSDGGAAKDKVVALAPARTTTPWPAVLPCDKPVRLRSNYGEKSTTYEWSRPGGPTFVLTTDPGGFSSQPVPEGLVAARPTELRVAGQPTARPAMPFDLQCAEVGVVRWRCDTWRGESRCLPEVWYPPTPAARVPHTLDHFLCVGDGARPCDDALAPLLATWPRERTKTEAVARRALAAAASDLAGFLDAVCESGRCSRTVDRLAADMRRVAKLPDAAAPTVEVDPPDEGQRSVVLRWKVGGLQLWLDHYLDAKNHGLGEQRLHILTADGTPFEYNPSMAESDTIWFGHNLEGAGDTIRLDAGDLAPHLEMDRNMVRLDER